MLPHKLVDHDIPSIEIVTSASSHPPPDIGKSRDRIQRGGNVQTKIYVSSWIVIALLLCYSTASRNGQKHKKSNAHFSASHM
jgi:hypothetical protein